MLNAIKNALGQKVGDGKLVENLFFSYEKICEEFVAQKPVDLLQNAGLFVESALRVAEHLVLGNHIPLEKKFDVDASIQKLEKASGVEGLRIHVARLSRVVYDFRTQKKAVHLKAIDPRVIDASLIFNIANWIILELLKESGIPKAEDAMRILFTRKIPLVQSVGGMLRTTNPKLLGTQRILMLLYAVPEGLTEEQLLGSTKQKIRTMDHLRKDLKNMDGRDLVHCGTDGRWVLFGMGFSEAEKLIERFSK
jgi:hypothetical protein